MYYNENYAGLAAEIFGLTEPSAIQCDDSSVIAEEQLLPQSDETTVEGEGEDVVQSESADADAVEVAVETVAVDLNVSL